MKLSIIGAGNVGGLLASRLLDLPIEEILLLDTCPGLAKAKALDLEDTMAVGRFRSCNIKGSEDIEEIGNSDIVVITAGFSRQPGMSREQLLEKNALIVKEISEKIKYLCPKATVLIVTNPVDILTYLVLKVTNFPFNKVLGIGVSLDAARFINLLSKELNVPSSEIETMVMGSHSETMLILERFTFIKGVALNHFLDKQTIEHLIEATKNRGSQIVSLYGKASAYFAPSLAVAEVIKVILKDERRILGVSTYLDGEYGIKDLCIGVPCILGKAGREKIIELKLSPPENTLFLKSVESLNNQKAYLTHNGIL